MVGSPSSPSDSTSARSYPRCGRLSRLRCPAGLCSVCSLSPATPPWPTSLRTCLPWQRCGWRAVCTATRRRRPCWCRKLGSRPVCDATTVEWHLPGVTSRSSDAPGAAAPGIAPANASALPGAATARIVGLLLPRRPGRASDSLSLCVTNGTLVRKCLVRKQERPDRPPTDRRERKVSLRRHPFPRARGCCWRVLCGCPVTRPPRFRGLSSP